MSKKVDIAGVNFDAITYNDVLTAIEVYVRTNKQVYITTPNPEMVLDANKNESFAHTLHDSEISIPDGIGILWASYYLGLPKRSTGIGKFLQLFSSLSKIFLCPKSIRKHLPERVTGSDLFNKIIEESQDKRWRIFLLGAAPGVAKIAIDRLMNKYPNAIFAGSYSGSPSENEEGYISEMVNKSNANILFVAYGSPAQEKWINRNLHKLETVNVAIGIGGAIDFAAGIVKRAPKGMQKLGLEWLWRLTKEPKRIKRIWNATVKFSSLMYKIKNKK